MLFVFILCNRILMEIHIHIHIQTNAFTTFYFFKLEKQKQKITTSILMVSISFGLRLQLIHFAPAAITTIMYNNAKNGIIIKATTIICYNKQCKNKLMQNVLH